MTSSAFRPDYANEYQHAGSFLEQTLEERSMKQIELADRTGLSSKTINAIIQGRAPLTPETAYSLELVFPDKPASTWIELDTNYQAGRARQRQYENLEAHVGILKEFPVDTMVSRGWMESKTILVDRLRELQKFFGVASVDQLDAVWARLSGMYRQSEAYTKSKLHVIAWLRQGEIQANKIECEPFTAESFKEALKECRKLTNSPFSVVEEALPEACRKAGVAVVFVKEIGETRTTGAARWVKDKAIIQLSLRGKFSDIFWFTFFHECGHILLHGKKESFIDGKKNCDEGDEIYGIYDLAKKEAEADAFAQDMLFPRKNLSTFLNSIVKGAVTSKQINDFAAEIGISPGIVLGHLQHRKIMGYGTKLNTSLKTKYDFNS